MKKAIYPALLLVLSVTLAFVYKRYDDKKNAIPPLQERSVTVGADSEWLNTKAAIEGLLDRLRRNPNDLKAKLQLAMAYVQESRVTGNHAYYDEAALTLVQQVLEKEPQNFDALCVKTTLLLSQHHFSEALVAAKNVVALFPDAAYGYGLLCDAYLELGQYQEAVKAADKMVDIRPDLRSYARVAYLRETFGDYEGAKQAMSMAVKAGVPGMEQTEWCRVQWGALHEATGDTARARQMYLMALAARSNYAYALAGLARLEKIKKNFAEATRLLDLANKNVIDFAFDEALIDILTQNNQVDAARQKAAQVIEQLSKHANDESAAPDKGHYADKELAYAYLRVNNPTQAVVHAVREWNRRPDNIEVNECLAWAYYHNNEPVKAAAHIEWVLKTGYKNPLTLWRAAQIFIKNNDLKRGKMLENQAFKMNPFLDTKA